MSELERLKPEYGERLAEMGEEAIYLSHSPTMRRVRDELGDTAINLWLASQVGYMFELCDHRLDQVKTNSLIRLIRAKYQWMRLTEFVHFVFLYRTGEFGKLYGKASGESVM